jgi:hypothetical protein
LYREGANRDFQVEKSMILGNSAGIESKQEPGTKCILPAEQKVVGEGLSFLQK